MERSDMPDRLDERSVLLQMLDYTRETAIWKTSGLSDEDAQRAPLATSPLSSIGGLLNHLRWVEHSWIEHRFAGRPDRGPWTEDDLDRELRLGLRTPLAEIVAGYREQIAVDDEIIAGADLDDLAVETTRNQHPNLRWTLQHLIEENSRHNGHLDVLRELADGTVGD